MTLVDQLVATLAELKVFQLAAKMVDSWVDGSVDSLVVKRVP